MSDLLSNVGLALILLGIGAVAGALWTEVRRRPAVQVYPHYDTPPVTFDGDGSKLKNRPPVRRS